MALHDIKQILSRPTLARLAKIEQVAEEVASTRSAPQGPVSATAPASSELTPLATPFRPSQPMTSP